jgi:transposase InsO family protein
MDSLVVPTIRFKMLFVWFMVTHGRREVLHFNVTEHPTAPWVIQQLREAFPDEPSIRFFIHDSDAIFSDGVLEAIRNLGIESEPTSLGSPWQNGISERWVGSVRRELLDHVVVLDEPHLRRLLRDYAAYYNEDRVHTRLRDAPRHRVVENRASRTAKIIGLPRIGWLHRGP